MRGAILLSRGQAECQRLGVPVCFHSGGRTSLTPDFSLGEIFGDRLMMWHTFDQPLGVMAAAVSLCGGGVLERFPELRVGLLKGNCSWAPWLLHRLDEHHEWVGGYEARDLAAVRWTQRVPRRTARVAISSGGC